MSTETPPDLSVDYFRNILLNQSLTLTELCDKWSIIQEQESQKQEEEFLGAIRTTIGQAKLLMSQRFKQFSQLIDDCQYKTGQHQTRLNDLMGFWDMINYQVEDVMAKFKSLDERFKEL